MTAKELWDRFAAETGTEAAYDAWAFCGGGEVGDQLAQLTLDGVKTATASPHIAYGLEGVPIPEWAATAWWSSPMERPPASFGTQRCPLCPSERYLRSTPIWREKGTGALATGEEYIKNCSCRTMRRQEHHLPRILSAFWRNLRWCTGRKHLTAAKRFRTRSDVQVLSGEH